MILLFYCMCFYYIHIGLDSSRFPNDFEPSTKYVCPIFIVLQGAYFSSVFLQPNQVGAHILLDFAYYNFMVSIKWLSVNPLQ